MCIDDADKNGVALGRIYLLADPTSTKKAGAKTSYALTLVAAGYARVDARHAAEKPSSEISELQEAQANALAEQRCMWSVPETVAEEELRQSGGGRGGRDRDANGEDGFAEEEETEVDMSRLAVTGPRTKGPSLRGDEERVTVRVCEISDGVNFFVHVVSESRTKLLQSIEQQMAAFASTRLPNGDADAAPSVSTPEVKKGQLVLALFDDRSGSGPAWFRARVEEVEGGGKKARVQFIDYGNRAVVSVSEIATVESSSSSSASKGNGVYFAQPPLALECSLAFLSPPSLAEDVHGDGLIRAAGLSLGDLTWDRELSMQIFGREYASGRLLVALYDDIVHDAKAEEGDAPSAEDAEKGAVSDNVFDGEGEESRKRRAALSLSQRVLSVNELVLMDGLARISRSSTRMLPRIAVPVQGKAGAGKVDRVLSPLAADLLVYLEEAQKCARRAHVSIPLLPSIAFCGNHLLSPLSSASHQSTLLNITHPLLFSFYLFRQTCSDTVTLLTRTRRERTTGRRREKRRIETPRPSRLFQMIGQHRIAQRGLV